MTRVAKRVGVGLLVVACLAAAGAWFARRPRPWKPGDVLSERSASLGGGYRHVHRSVVNGPDHWEAVGHFSTVTFEDLRLCQCSPDEVSFSPDRRLAVFLDDDGRLRLFDSLTRTFRTILPDFVGLPEAVEWDSDGLGGAVWLKQPGLDAWMKIPFHR